MLGCTKKFRQQVCQAPKRPQSISEIDFLEDKSQLMNLIFLLPKISLTSEIWRTVNETMFDHTSLFVRTS